MYYDDYMSPTNDNDVNSVDLKKNKLMESIKPRDKNYVKMTKNVNTKWRDGKYYDTVTLELYGANGVGTRIRNAITGSKTPYLVGSKYEDLFFKVSECSGVNGLKDPLQLYYDSPEQYENHFFVMVDSTIKSNWHKRNLLAKREYGV